MSAGLSILAPIGDLIEKVASWNPVRDAPDDELNYIDLSAVDNETKTVTSIQNLQGCNAPSRARQLVKSGDILVSTVRPNLNGVARVPDEYDGATASTGFCVLRPKRSKLDGSYLFHWVRSSDFVADMVRKATGASYPAVSDKIIAQSEIPLPSLEEQKQIAAILDQADELRRKRLRALDRLNQLGQAIFYEMFGDPWGDAYSSCTMTVGSALKSGKIIAVQDGNHGEKHPKVSDFSATGIPFIMANCLVNGEISLQKAYRLDPTWRKKLRTGFTKALDVLISHKGTIGQTAVVPEGTDDLILSPQVTYYRLSEAIDPYFLQSYFDTSHFQSIIRKDAIQSTRSYIGITRQLELPILVPPIEEQLEFKSRIVSLRKLRKDYSYDADVLRRLQDSLQHRAFRGELTASSLTEAAE